jgi:hypothetical protein
MKGHKHHHHEHKGVMHHGVHHKHPRAEHKVGGEVKTHGVDEGLAKEGDFYADEAPTDIYAGEKSPTAAEAKQKKHGGRTKRKHGGHVHHMGKVHGEHAKHRADRPKRKSGGKVGSNMHPLSTAHAGHEPKAHKSYEPEEHGK